jgi:hypothetical protein
MKLYLELLAGETRRSVKPVLITDDPDLIAAFGKLVAEKMGVELPAQLRMALPPKS